MGLDEPVVSGRRIHRVCESPQEYMAATKMPRKKQQQNTATAAHCHGRS